MSGPHPFDRARPQFGPLPASKELQEDRDPIVGGLALVDGQVIGERSGGDSDPISTRRDRAAWAVRSGRYARGSESP